MVTTLRPGLAAPALVAALATAVFGWTALLFGLLAVLAVIDARTQTVPDALTLALAATGLAHTLANGSDVAPAATAAALLLATGYALGELTPDDGPIGSGDFFLFAGAAAWLGPWLMADVLILTSVFLALHCIVSRRRTRALAPSLGAATALVWLGGPLL